MDDDENSKRRWQLPLSEAPEPAGQMIWCQLVNDDKINHFLFFLAQHAHSVC